MPQEHLASWPGRTVTGSSRSATSTTTSPQLLSTDEAQTTPLLDLHSPLNERRILLDDAPVSVHSSAEMPFGSANWLSRQEIDVTKRKTYRSYAEDWCVYSCLAVLLAVLNVFTLIRVLTLFIGCVAR